MSNINVFFNAKLHEGFGSDSFFAPIRYFNDGKTVTFSDDEEEVNSSLSYPADSKSSMLTLGMILAFIPGLIIGSVAKAIVLLLSSDRSRMYKKANQHFNEYLDLSIKKIDAKSKISLNDLKEFKLNERFKNLCNQKIKTVTIDGDSTLKDLEKNDLCLEQFKNKGIKYLYIELDDDKKTFTFHKENSYGNNSTTTTLMIR
ncbi:MAG: hypothetical protein WDZ28_04895 [Simkaniaceae bacterium]